MYVLAISWKRNENECETPWNFSEMKVSVSSAACLEIALGNTGWHKKNVKIQGYSCSFDFAESEYDKQIAPSPTSVKGKGIKLQI